MPSRADLAKIHIAKKELGLSDDEYRDILQFRFKKDSAKDLSASQVGVLLAVFKLAGWKPRRASIRQGGRSSQNTANTAPADPQSRKIRALWITLGHTGAVRNPDEMALNKYCKRMVKVDALRFADTNMKSRLIEFLKEWQVRDLVTTIGATMLSWDMQTSFSGKNKPVLVWQKK